MKTYKKNDEVWIINCTMSGKFIIEGKARVISNSHDQGYNVRFDGDDSNVVRFIDDNAQKDPEAWVKILNEQVAKQ